MDDLTLAQPDMDALINSLAQLYDDLLDGAVSKEAFQPALDTVIGDMLIANATVPILDSQQLLVESLLLKMQADQNYTPGGAADIDLSLTKLVDTLSLTSSDEVPPTQTPENESPQEVVGHGVQVFVDANNDGKISLEETLLVDEVPDATNVIGVVDLNKDGVIDAADLGDDTIQIINANPVPAVGDDGAFKIGTWDLDIFNSYSDDVKVTLAYDENGDGHIDANDRVVVERIADPSEPQEPTDPETPSSDSDAEVAIEALLDVYDAFIEGDAELEELLEVTAAQSEILLNLSPLSAEETVFLETVATKIVADGFLLDADTDFTNSLNKLVTDLSLNVTNQSDNGVDFFTAVTQIAGTFTALKAGTATTTDLVDAMEMYSHKLLTIDEVDGDAIDGNDALFLKNVLIQINNNYDMFSSEENDLIDELTGELMTELGLKDTRPGEGEPPIKPPVDPNPLGDALEGILKSMTDLINDLVSNGNDGPMSDIAVTLKGVLATLEAMLKSLDGANPETGGPLLPNPEDDSDTDSEDDTDSDSDDGTTTTPPTVPTTGLEDLLSTMAKTLASLQDMLGDLSDQLTNGGSTGTTTTTDSDTDSSSGTDSTSDNGSDSDSSTGTDTGSTGSTDNGTTTTTGTDNGTTTGTGTTGGGNSTTTGTDNGTTTGTGSTGSTGNGTSSSTDDLLKDLLDKLNQDQDSVSMQDLLDALQDLAETTGSNPIQAIMLGQDSAASGPVVDNVDYQEVDFVQHDDVLNLDGFGCQHNDELGV